LARSRGWLYLIDPPSSPNQPRVRLYVVFPRDLKLEPAETSEYFDESLPGFAVRIFPSGRRVFTLLYRMKGGRTKKKERVDIGTHPPLTLAQARDLATKLKAEIQLGKDPRREPVPARPAEASVVAADGPTVKQLCEAYLVHPSGGGRLRAASTLPHYRRLIDAEIIAVFGDRRAAAITRTEVREWSEGSWTRNRS